MGNIFSDVGEQTVFRNENVLSPEYLPDQFPHRQGQIEQIANCIKPAIAGRRPHNCFVVGPPGVGKTGVVRFVFKELSEFERVVPIYVNCWEYNTRHAVLSKVLNQLGGLAPRRGVATDEVFDRFIRQLKDKIPIIALDEVDQLISKDGSKLLYDLVRTNEQQRGSQLAIIAVSNDAFVMRSLDARVKSSLSQEEIFFNTYSERELKDIVRERIGLAFRKGFYEEGILPRCAKEAAERGGDVRFALECLWKAGREADRQGEKVGMNHLNIIFKKTGDVYAEEIIKGLSAPEKAILKIIARNAGITSGELYEEYSKKSKHPVADRTFRNYVTRFETLNLIDAPLSGKGFKGQSRVISLKVDPSAVLKAAR